MAKQKKKKNMISFGKGVKVGKAAQKEIDEYNSKSSLMEEREEALAFERDIEYDLGDRKKKSGRMKAAEKDDTASMRKAILAAKKRNVSKRGQAAKSGPDFSKLSPRLDKKKKKK